MKRTFLIASIAVLVSALMVGCGGGPVTKYMKELDPILDIAKKVVEPVSRISMEDPAGSIDILKEQVLPTFEDYLKKLEALTDTIKDEKIKAAHLILVESGRTQLAGYQIMLTGFVEEDMEAIQGAQTTLAESQRLAGEFQAAITALTK